MSNLALIRTAVVAKAAAVPGMGLVHDRERYAKSEKDFRDQYLYERGDGKTEVRGWSIKRVSTRELTAGLGRGIDEHTWQLRGYRAFNDEEASSTDFDEVIEAFRDAVRADPTFGGVCTSQWSMEDGESELVEVLDSGPVIFCDVLCHSALLQLRTRSYL